MDLDYYKGKLEEAGVSFAPGLSEQEAQRAELIHHFKFPPDLKAFLMHALPASAGWPNWREESSPAIVRMMNWPLEGIWFDIRNNVFCPEEWGPRPDSLDVACAVAKSKVAEAPKLIPVCGHRYIPDAPEQAGNPVFSVYQTDIIYYGTNLWNYLENEFRETFKTEKHDLRGPIRQIEFWSWLVERD